MPSLRDRPFGLWGIWDFVWLDFLGVTDIYFLIKTMRGPLNKKEKYFCVTTNFFSFFQKHLQDNFIFWEKMVSLVKNMSSTKDTDRCIRHTAINKSTQTISVWIHIERDFQIALFNGQSWPHINLSQYQIIYRTSFVIKKKFFLKTSAVMMYELCAEESCVMQGLQCCTTLFLSGESCR